MVKKLGFCIVLVLLTFITYSQQDKVTYNHRSFWSKTEVTEIFGNKFGVGFDFIYRANNELNQGSIFSRWHRFSYRPWIHYQHSKNFRVSLNPLSYFDTQEYFAKESDFNRRPYYELRTTLQIVHQHNNLT
jgi:hypothetical protein